MSKAELFSQTFCKNSTLDDSGHIPPTYPPSVSFMTVIKILHYDVYYVLKRRSTGDLLSLLTDFWSSSLSRFGEIFSVALDISKAFDKVWHKSLLSKLPSVGFYPFLCSFISSFHSRHSISAVVNGHCSSPKPINSGVPQGFLPLPSLFNPQKGHGPDGVPPIVLKNCASVLTPFLVKLFRLCLSTSTFPSCWKYAYVQPVPKKGDRSNPSNYRPIALLSCLSKAFESILNRNIQKHLSTFYLPSDRQYAFLKRRSTGDLLSLLTDFWSSSLSRFGEIFSVALDISKAFDKVWHKSLLSKLPSVGFYPFLCSFHSRHSISAVVNGHCSSPKPINSGVPQGFVPLPTLFLLFINDLSVTNCSIHSYADDSTLHFSTSFDRRPTLQDLQDSRLEAAERLTSDLALISDWGRRNLVSFNASKTQLSIYQLDITFQTPILYSSTTHSYHPFQH